MRTSKILRGAFALVLTVALAVGLGTAAFAADTSFGFSVGDTMQIKEVILKSRDNSDINVEISKLDELEELWEEIGGKKMADAVAQDRSMNDPKCTRENLEENGESKVVFTTCSPTIVVVPSEVKPNVNGKLVFYGIALDVPDGTEVEVYYGKVVNGEMPSQQKLSENPKVENGVVEIVIGKELVRNLQNGDQLGIVLVYTLDGKEYVNKSIHIYGGLAQAPAMVYYGSGSSGSGSSATPEPTEKPVRHGISLTVQDSQFSLNVEDRNWWGFATEGAVVPGMTKVVGDGTSYLTVYNGVLELKIPLDSKGLPSIGLNLDGQAITSSGAIISDIAGYWDSVSGAVQSGLNITDYIGGGLNLGSIGTGLSGLLKDTNLGSSQWGSLFFK